MVDVDVVVIMVKMRKRSRGQVIAVRSRVGLAVTWRYFGNAWMRPRKGGSIWVARRDRRKRRSRRRSWSDKQSQKTEKHSNTGYRTREEIPRRCCLKAMREGSKARSTTQCYLTDATTKAQGEF